MLQHTADTEMTESRMHVYLGCAYACSLTQYTYRILHIQMYHNTLGFYHHVNVYPVQQTEYGGIRQRIRHGYNWINLTAAEVSSY